jgi:hypothetical protein
MSALEEIKEIVAELAQDRKIPRNVRAVLENAVKELENESLPEKTRVNTVITMLDEISNDPNLQPFSRTEIWNVVSMLEMVQKSLE